MERLECNETVLPSFPSYPPRPVDTIIGMLSFFCILGSVGNALVLYVYVRKRNKLPSTIFIISLACTDLSVCLMVMPYTMIVESLNHVITYDVLCKLYLFLITSNVPFSAFIMVAIAVDRYLCICHPHHRLLDARKAKLVLLSLIFLSMALGVITALAFGVYQLSTRTVDQNEEIRNGTNYTLNVQKYCIDNFTATINCSDILHDNICREFPTELFIVYTGVCMPNQLIFTSVFRKTYQKLYAGMFLVAFVVVFVLYILIYKSVMERRSKKMRLRRKTLSIYRETSMTEPNPTDGNRISSSGRNNSRRAMIDRDGCIKEKYWLANIRTALMLFVVTLVFIIAFLPSWLMAHRVVYFNSVVFYMYFAYNVSNPIIYAFMNPAFRRELRDLIIC